MLSMGHVLIPQVGTVEIFVNASLFSTKFECAFRLVLILQYRFSKIDFVFIVRSEVEQTNRRGHHSLPLWYESRRRPADS